MPGKMKAAIFLEPGRIVLGEKPVPKPGPLDALIRITMTTICGTDVHILKGEYPVARGLTIGHEPVGVIEKLGAAVTGFAVGQRVIAGAITPCGTSNACLSGVHSQCGHGTAHGWKPLGGWRFGNTIDGAQAEYLLVPDAMANLAVIPDGLSDAQVLMCPDILSTGLGGAEKAGIRMGDSVAVFAQGPIGLCATAGARLMGAATIIGVEALSERQAMARHMGADHIVDFSKSDPVAAIMRLTGGRGVDVAIEALGRQETFEAALRVLRPGGTLSSLGGLLGGPQDSARRLRRRFGRPPDPDHALPRRKGAYAPAHGAGRSRPGRYRPAGDSSFRPRRDRSRLRSVRASAGRRTEGGDHPLK